MTHFSALLSHFIQLKEISVFPLTQYCGIDRSTMYKYINGKRLPPRQELVEQIADCLRLSPSERQKLLSAWKIIQIGEENYYSRKNVENFILNFPDTFRINSPEVSLFSDHFTSTQLPENLLGVNAAVRRSGCVALPSRTAVNHAVIQMILNEARKRNGRLALLLQPDHEYLFHFLTALGESGCTLNIEHILCLNRTIQTNKSKISLNLLYLQKILPLYMRALNYNVYYYYDNVDARFSSFNGLSCLILTGESAISCTSDHSSGIFYSQPETVRILWDQFLRYKEKCAALFKTVNTLSEELDMFNTLGQGMEDSYAIQSEPCLIPFISPDLVGKYIRPDLPGRESLIPVLNDFLASQRKRICSGNFHVYQTLSGIRSFLETGQINEIPDGICFPLSPADRKLLISCLLQNAGKKYRLLFGPLRNLPGNFHLYVSSSGGYLLFTDRLNRTVYLLFQESSLLTVFLDYMSHLDSKYFFTYEQMQSLLQELLKEGE